MCRSTIYCIVPPHVLQAMVESPDSKVRRWASANIEAAATARAARATLAELRPRMAPTFMGSGSSKKTRTIHDAKYKPNLNGKIVRREGDPATGDKEVDEAYRFSGYTHDFYRRVFKRNSIDDNGMPLKSTVRYREDPSSPYNNAFWWQQQMAYGEGDGIVFKRFTIALDVVAHELTHGVVEFTANLVYRSEPGALNEHFADAFGSMIKQWKKKQTAKQADWLIGDALINKAPTRKALRSMKAPGTAFVNDPHLKTDPQPAHMNDKYTGFKDKQGVHINSGIPNHAFYLAATSIGGPSWAKAGKIWYESLCRLQPTSDFADFAEVTTMVAGMRYGLGSKEDKAVKAAWKAVGL